MASIEKKFAAKVLSRYGQHLAWPVSNSIELGDYGVLDGDRFIYTSNISKLGWWSGEFGYDYDESADGSLDFISADGTAIGVKGSGSYDKVKGDVSFSYTQDDACMLQARKIRNIRFDNYNRIGNVLMDKAREDRWDRDHVVVMELQKAEHLFATYSTEKNTSLTIHVADAADSIAEAEFSVKHQSSAVSVWSKHSKQAVLVTLFKVKKPLGGSWSFELV